MRRIVVENPIIYSLFQAQLQSMRRKTNGMWMKEMNVFSESIKRNIKSPFEDPEEESNLEDDEVDVPITNLNNPNRSTSATISVG